MSEQGVKTQPDDTGTNKRRANIGGVFILVVLVVVAGKWCLSLDDREGDVAKALAAAKLNPASLEGAAAEVLLSRVGPEVNNWAGQDHLPTLISVGSDEQAAGDMKGSYLVNLEYRDDGDREMLLFRARDVMRGIFESPKCSKAGIVMLRPQGLYTNELGKQVVLQSAKMVLDQKTAAQIGWDAVTVDAFENILQKYGTLNLHPALRKQ